MNIKLKAGLETVGFVAVIILVIAGLQTLIKYFINTYGTEAAINGAAFCFVSVAAYVAVSILYDIRVAQLEYRAKLKEMTKK